MGASERANGHPLGIHRVLDKLPRLPQAADRLDNSLPIYDNEILIEVERLNIDAASFVQMEKEFQSPDAVGKKVIENTKARGKQHNPVTGSGGMLVGKVAAIGSKYKGPCQFKVVDRMATLVSLTLTPLNLTKIKNVNQSTHQIEVEGHAVLFERSIAARLPSDIPEPIATALFDVAGAPASVNHLCKPGDTVVILGAGGKAGILCCAAARNRVGEKGLVVGIEPFPQARTELMELGICNAVLDTDATNAVSVHSSVSSATHGKMGNVVVNVVSVADTEMSSLLSASPSGKVLFFGMAASFTKVALGAEAVGVTASLLFGNGYFPGHSDFVLELFRSHAGIQSVFKKRYL